LQRAFAAALVVEKIGLAALQHHVARLKIAIEKIIVAGAEQEFGQAREVLLQRLLVEGNAGEPQKIILEIVEVPGDGLAVETGARIADFVVQIATGLDLKTGQHGDHVEVGLNGLRSDGIAGAMLAQEIEESGVAQVLFDVGVLAQIFRINFRHWQSVAAEMAGELKEGDVLLAHGIGVRWRARSRRAGPEAAARARPASGNAARKAASGRP